MPAKRKRTEHLGGPKASTARRLRVNPTDAERVLWSRLRNREIVKYKFRRQVPRERFVVDFACLEHRLVVEVDGSQHATQVEADDERTQWLESRGYRVLRFWNNDVLQNTDGVLKMILLELEQLATLSHPHPPIA